MAKFMSITDIINNTNISKYFTIQELYQASSILPRCEIEHFDTETALRNLVGSKNNSSSKSGGEFS